MPDFETFFDLFPKTKSSKWSNWSVKNLSADLFAINVVYWQSLSLVLNLQSKFVLYNLSKD